MGVPSMFAAILRLKNASPEDFKTVYAMISGGEPLPATLREAFLAAATERALDACRNTLLIERFIVPDPAAYGIQDGRAKRIDR